MDTTLHVFPFSNYCEKALWACDVYGVKPKLVTHYPGPHAGKIRKLSQQTAVPVLETGDKVIAGSADIVAQLAVDRDDDPLVPAEHRDAIMKWQAELDKIGATVRGVLFYDILPKPKLATGLLTAGAVTSSFKPYALFFRAFTPMLKSMLRKGMPNPEAARAECTTMLDRLAADWQKDGYLVGGQFTLADLCAAAFFFPMAFPQGCMGYDHAKRNPELNVWRGRWQGHPALPHIERIYRDHR